MEIKSKSCPGINRVREDIDKRIDEKLAEKLIEKAPVSHASSDNKYGIASTTSYGHYKFGTDSTKLTVPTGLSTQLLNGIGVPITPTSTPSNASAVPFTAGGAYTELAKKIGISDLTNVRYDGISFWTGTTGITGKKIMRKVIKGNIAVLQSSVLVNHGINLSRGIAEQNAHIESVAFYDGSTYMYGGGLSAITSTQVYFEKPTQVSNTAYSVQWTISYEEA